MAIKYELVASAGTYTDRNGEEKKRWHKCGIVMTTKSGGLSAKVESLPIGWDGWLNLWEPKPKDNANVSEGGKQVKHDDDTPDDDIPW